MTGFHTNVDLPGADWTPHESVSVVVCPAFPDIPLIRKVLAAGVKQEPEETVWVVRSTGTTSKDGKDDSTRAAFKILIGLGVDPIVLEANRDYWPSAQAGKWRDTELVANSKVCLVFHDQKSGVTQWFADQIEYQPKGRIAMVERGKPREIKRKARKPIGE